MPPRGVRHRPRPVKGKEKREESSQLQDWAACGRPLGDKNEGSGRKGCRGYWPRLRSFGRKFGSNEDIGSAAHREQRGSAIAHRASVQIYNHRVPESGLKGEHLWTRDGAYGRAVAGAATRNRSRQPRDGTGHDNWRPRLDPNKVSTLDPRQWPCVNREVLRLRSAQDCSLAPGVSLRGSELSSPLWPPAADPSIQRRALRLSYHCISFVR